MHVQRFNRDSGTPRRKGGGGRKKAEPHPFITWSTDFTTLVQQLEKDELVQIRCLNDGENIENFVLDGRLDCL